MSFTELLGGPRRTTMCALRDATRLEAGRSRRCPHGSILPQVHRGDLSTGNFMATLSFAKVQKRPSCCTSALATIEGNRQVKGEDSLLGDIGETNRVDGLPIPSWRHSVCTGFRSGNITSRDYAHSVVERSGRESCCHYRQGSENCLHGQRRCSIQHGSSPRKRRDDRRI